MNAHHGLLGPSTTTLHGHRVVGVYVGSLVRISDHSADFLDFVLEQPGTQLVCRQESYLKNSVE